LDPCRLVSFAILTFLFPVCLALCPGPLSADEGDSPVCLIAIEGAIGPAATAYVEEGFEAAQRKGSPLLLITMDTPGGLSAATRDIVKLILNAPIPVAVLVYPQGARAASAGTYILYSSHIAAMAPACTVGAATPVQMGGSPLRPKEEEGPPPEEEGAENGEKGSEKAEKKEKGAPPVPADAKERKVVNDAVAFIRGLAEKRGRNAEWAEKAVREAASIKTGDAIEKDVIDLVADSPETLLEQIDGRKVALNGQEVVLSTAGRGIFHVAPNWRIRLLSALTNPNLAYILLIVGIYGLLLEGYNPGAIVPGVVGAICLFLAFYALQILPVNMAGIGLILIGAILMVSEAFVPSFGALGIGGVIALVLGGIFLIDPGTPGYGVDPALVSAVGIAAGLLFLAVTAYLVRARRRPVVSGSEELIGKTAQALTGFEAGQGTVFVRGERWRARSSFPVRKEEAVRIQGMEGLTLIVAPESETEAGGAQAPRE
jgi:membrane-bound serine protease (ClpP class)